MESVSVTLYVFLIISLFTSCGEDLDNCGEPIVWHPYITIVDGEGNDFFIVNDGYDPESVTIKINDRSLSTNSSMINEQNIFRLRKPILMNYGLTMPTGI